MSKDKITKKTDFNNHNHKTLYINYINILNWKKISIIQKIVPKSQKCSKTVRKCIMECDEHTLTSQEINLVCNNIYFSRFTIRLSLSEMSINNNDFK